MDNALYRWMEGGHAGKIILNSYGIVITLCTRALFFLKHKHLKDFPACCVPAKSPPAGLSQSGLQERPRTLQLRTCVSVAFIHLQLLTSEVYY